MEKDSQTHNEMPKTKEEWKKILTPEQYKILREKGTEAPFTGELLKEKREGMYECAACGNLLFSSDTKFESGTGWPSFDKSLPGAVKYIPDKSGGMNRTEIVCAKCGSHLGHVFDDLSAVRQAAPNSRGKRYCINSVCLKFEPKEKRGS